AAASLDQLRILTESSKKDNLHSQNTNKAYNRHIKNGKKFLADLVQARKAASQADADCPKDVEESINLDALEVAFEKPPNQYSALGLELYLTEKCIKQNLKEQTAVQIYSAFKRMWQEMDAETYRGDYSYDPKSKVVRGNPALSAGVQDLWHSLRNRSRAAHGTRTHHAEAIGIEDMRAIMAWSEIHFPAHLLSCTITDAGFLFQAIVHFEMRAFLATAFTLWTRNNELCALKGKDFREGCVGPAPYYFPHDKVTLDQRKGWQSRPGSGAHSQGRTYEIHAQPKTPEICMRTHLSRWLRLREKVLGRRMTEEEYVFPHISPNGLIHTSQALNHDVVQKTLDDFAKQAGLDKNFSTHSFRRGGAQYRFIWAPIGQRWSLARVRWWGGWSEGERTDTLIRYLLDEITALENEHGDALAPVQTRRDLTFNGEDSLAAPVTVAEHREHADSLDRKLDSFITFFVAYLHGNGPSPPMTAPTMAASSSHSSVSPSVLPVPPIIMSPTHTLGSAGSQSLQEHIAVPLTTVSNQTQSERPPRRVRSKRSVPSVPQASIPDLPRGAAGWKVAVRQWEEVDPLTGYALKDWPKSWYTGGMRLVNQQKRFTRRIITEAFVR
ncbi:hypothetical protein GLOTRDRAFT_27428, partial [Gloeophyllum trabeum ATCC 11539]